MSAGARVDLADGWRVGEDKTLVFTVTDDRDLPIPTDGWTCRYRLWPGRAAHGTPPLITTDVTGAAGKIVVNISGIATSLLAPGTYEHSLWRVDTGLMSCLASDTVELGGDP